MYRAGDGRNRRARQRQADCRRCSPSRRAAVALPAPPPRRGAVLPSGALLLSAVLACQGATPPPAPGPAPPAASPPPAAGAAETGTAALRLDALAAAIDRPAPLYLRNPFRFPDTPAGSDPAPRAAPGGTPRAARTSRVRTSGTPLADPGDRTAAAPAAAPVDAFPLRVIGVVNAPDPAGLVAVVTDGRRVLHGRINDVFHGRYRLLAIEAASITVEDVQGGNRDTLPRPDPDAPPAAGP